MAILLFCPKVFAKDTISDALLDTNNSEIQEEGSDPKEHLSKKNYQKEIIVHESNFLLENSGQDLNSTKRIANDLGSSTATLRPTQVLFVPLGGKSILLDNVIFCPNQSFLGGFRFLGTTGLDARRLQPPPLSDKENIATLFVAQTLEACENAHTEFWQIIATPGYPKVDPASVVWRLDEGRIDLQGKFLKNSRLIWQIGDRFGSDICTEPTAIAATEHRQACSFRLPTDLLGDLDALSLRIFPDLSSEDPTHNRLYHGNGSQLRPDKLVFRANKLLLRYLLPPGSALNSTSSEVHLPLLHSETLASVQCLEAQCRIEGNFLLVGSEHGSDDRLDLIFKLRSGVFIEQQGSSDASGRLQIPIQRCPLSLVSAPPLTDFSSQKIVLKIGGHCADELKTAEHRWSFSSHGIPIRIWDIRREADSLYVVLAVDFSIPAEFLISMQGAESVLGLLHVKSRSASSPHARVQLDTGHEIDFIPNNRRAQIYLPVLPEGGRWKVLPFEGIYEVFEPHMNNFELKAYEGLTGWVNLKLALVDDTLPAGLRDLTLLESREIVSRQLRSAHVPITLSQDSNEHQGLCTLICSDKEGKPQTIQEGRLYSADFRLRDTCRLLLDPSWLKPEDGEQLFSLAQAVSSLDGIVYPESQFEQQIFLKYGDSKQMFYLRGIKNPFDRVVVRASVVREDPHYVQSSQTNKLAPQLQWSMISGKNRWRLYASASIPSGLFRLAEKKHSGILGLNAGGLMRLAFLTADGWPTPLGLEAGCMWMGIAGDSSSSPHGEFAFVAGVGISVPFANVSRLTQAAVSIHAWAEYEVTRHLFDESGSPWGFVFGPSISIGNIGFNL